MTSNFRSFSWHARESVYHRKKAAEFEILKKMFPQIWFRQYFKWPRFRLTLTDNMKISFFFISLKQKTTRLTEKSEIVCNTSVPWIFLYLNRFTDLILLLNTILKYLKSSISAQNLRTWKSIALISNCPAWFCCYASLPIRVLDISL